MRTTTFTAALALALSTVAQDTTATACLPYERTEVVKVDSATAQQLYQRAKRWFVDNFKDANQVIQLDDPANATVVGNGAFAFNPFIVMFRDGRIGVISFTLSVECKEGRYRYQFYNVRHTSKWMGPILDCAMCCPAYQTVGKAPERNHQRVCAEEIMPTIASAYPPLIASLKAAMEVRTKASDW